MTVVVGLKDGGSIYLGADKLIVGDSVVATTEYRKIVSLGPLTMATGGDLRFMQAIQTHITPKEYEEGELYEYLVHHLVLDLRELRSAIGKDLFFAIVTDGKDMFVLDTDLSVLPKTEAALGCGAEFALGSLYSTSKTEMSPKKRIREAIKAAATYNVYVGKSVDIKEI